eukprot:scaffold491284_cov15-Prasinocladus_malaysianus.AAC.1
MLESAASCHWICLGANNCGYIPGQGRGGRLLGIWPTQQPGTRSNGQTLRPKRPTRPPELSQTTAAS